MTLQLRKVKISGTGKYLPKQQITAEQMDEKLNVSKGWVKKKTGVHIRHFVQDETASQMGAEAAKKAIKGTGLTFF